MTQLCFGKMCNDWRKDRCERCADKAEQKNSDAPHIATCRTKAGAYPLFRWTPATAVLRTTACEKALATFMDRA
jgi:hypothetical protein